MRRIYPSRSEAGKELATHLTAYAGRSDVIVLALPRGGIPVAFEVVEALGVPLDVYLVRKLGVPGHEELAMGALAEGGVRFLNEELIRSLDISPSAIEAAITSQEMILTRQAHTFRGEDPPPDLGNKTVILIDDGLATGATMAASIMAVRKQNPAKIIVAIPVAPPDTCHDMSRLADDVICPMMPEAFGAVGYWYADFSPVDDEAAQDLLRQARHSLRAGQSSG